ncbi:hypothetical protein EV182_001423 [Spiromyces aspiralis]|uniref:Uncharacterized protein n=1 Tax=Spiromyces aspiralis TaxID=68401 RepID=A0ACC1HHZ5_9FUNG|nr:hypothetical protein EV182_001423 [Spiromyces aspiralis]
MCEPGFSDGKVDPQIAQVCEFLNQHGLPSLREVTLYAIAHEIALHTGPLRRFIHGDCSAARTVHVCTPTCNCTPSMAARTVDISDLFSGFRLEALQVLEIQLQVRADRLSSILERFPSLHVLMLDNLIVRDIDDILACGRQQQWHATDPLCCGGSRPLLYPKLRDLSIVSLIVDDPASLPDIVLNNNGMSFDNLLASLSRGGGYWFDLSMFPNLGRFHCGSLWVKDRLLRAFSALLIGSPMPQLQTLSFCTLHPKYADLVIANFPNLRELSLDDWIVKNYASMVGDAIASFLNRLAQLERFAVKYNGYHGLALPLSAFDVPAGQCGLRHLDLSPVTFVAADILRVLSNFCRLELVDLCIGDLGELRRAIAPKIFLPNIVWLTLHISKEDYDDKHDEFRALVRLLPALRFCRIANCSQDFIERLCAEFPDVRFSPLSLCVPRDSCV